jgi:hypothetical protein
MTSIKINSEIKFYLFMGLFLLFLVAKEAYIIPVTHDEVNTIDLSQRSVVDIISYTDPVPNNHILNTLLVKMNIAIFGDHLFSARLHNVLSFIFFFLFVVLIGQTLFKESWLRFVFIAMVTLQPYLLDFYSVTRGYGLSITFETISLFYFFNTLLTKSQKSLFYTAIFGAVGVYANFTLLNFYLPLIFLLAVFSYSAYFKEDRKLFYKSILSLSTVSVVLLSLCYLPFARMMETKQFVYWGTNGFVSDTLKSLIISLRAGTEYFGWTNDQYYSIVLFCLVIGFVSTLLLWKHHSDLKIFKYAISLLLLVVLYNHIQFWLAGVPFLNARTALFFIPLTCVILCLGLDAFLNFNKSFGLILILCIGSISIQHFVRGFNGKSTYEWYNDADTNLVLKELNDIVLRENISRPVKLNCNWIFHPSLSYHIEHDYKDIFVLVPYHKDIQPESDALFYYATGEEKEQLAGKYNVINEYAWKTRVLLKLK